MSKQHGYRRIRLRLHEPRYVYELTTYCVKSDYERLDSTSRAIADALRDALMVAGTLAHGTVAALVYRMDLLDSETLSSG